MKLLCRDSLDSCRRVAAELAGRDIPSEIRHDDQPSLLPGTAAVLPELWLTRDADFERAWALLNQEPQSADEDE